VKSDLMALEKGCHVVVGTPGRVIDHLKRGTLRLEGVHFVVLDKQMPCSISFVPRYRLHPRTAKPKQRQTASARPCR
jgi:ATP-dependent RNA helicase DeaD